MGQPPPGHSHREVRSAKGNRAREGQLGREPGRAPSQHSEKGSAQAAAGGPAPQSAEARGGKLKSRPSAPLPPRDRPKELLTPIQAMHVKPRGPAAESPSEAAPEPRERGAQLPLPAAAAHREESAATATAKTKPNPTQDPSRRPLGANGNSLLCLTRSAGVRAHDLHRPRLQPSPAEPLGGRHPVLLRGASGRASSLSPRGRASGRPGLARDEKHPKTPEARGAGLFSAAPKCLETG